jgi:multidrug resistance efflux pump
MQSEMQMKRVQIFSLISAALVSAAAMAVDPVTAPGTSTAPATTTAPAIATVLPQPAAPDAISATGRILATNMVRPSPRINGHLVSLGTSVDGKTLDSGMRVKKGDVLFNLDQTTYKNAEAAAAAALAVAEANLADMKSPMRPERIEQLKAAISELQTRLDEHKVDEERYKRLVEEKTAPVKRLEEAQANVRASTAIIAAAKSRLAEAENGATKSQIAIAEARVAEANVALKTAQDDLRDTSVRAPFDGLITRRFKTVGDYIASNPPVEVFELLDTSTMEVELRIPETYFSRIIPGKTKVTLVSTLDKSETTHAVSRIIRHVDPERGTFPLRVALPGDTKLVLGGFVTANIELEPSTEGVIIPLASIRNDAKGDYIFITSAEKKAERFAVSVTQRFTEKAKIKQMPPKDARIVANPPATLKEGDPIP